MRFHTFLCALGLGIATLCGIAPGKAQAQGLVVTKTDDTDDGVCDADCSLREAVGVVNSGAGGLGQITFDTTKLAGPQTIKLNSELKLVRNTNITSYGQLTIDGQHTSRVFNAVGAQLILVNVTVANGNANADETEDLGQGGCIRISNGQLGLFYSTVTGGTAAKGGGIYSDSGDINIQTATIAGNAANVAPALGGGLYIEGTLEPRIIAVTIAGNSASTSGSSPVGAGGGIYGTPNLYLSTTLVGANTAATFPDVYSTANKINSQGYNLIGDPAGTQGLVSTDVTNVDPGLERDPNNGNVPFLKNNGGTKATIALLAGSPAIDKGKVFDTGDERGVSRDYGAAPDIGSYEAEIGRLDRRPTISQVRLSPPNAYAGERLEGDVIASDPDGDALTFTYTWTRNRGGVTTTVAQTGGVSEASAFLDTTGLAVQGDVITLTVIASDGLKSSFPSSASLTLVNSPVSITEVKLTPRVPFTGDKLVASVKAVDLDRTPINFTYHWFRNGVEVKTVTKRDSVDIVDLNNPGYNKGDVIRVSIEARDASTSATGEAQVTIQNSAPVVSLLTLGPASPTPTQVVISTYGARDADGDTLTRTYKWRVGTKILKDEKGARVDLSKYPFVKAGDVVSVDLQLFDGTAYSKTLTAKVTVGAGSPQPLQLAPSAPSA